VWTSPANDSRGGWRKSSFGICVKPGLWTGLDYGLDWTDQNSCMRTANATKATTVCPQLCLNLCPCCWVLEALSSRFLRGQRSHRTTLNKGGSGWLLMGSVNGFEHPWLVSTASYGGHMHLLGKHLHQSLIELWLERFAHLKD